MRAVLHTNVVISATLIRDESDRPSSCVPEDPSEGRKDEIVDLAMQEIANRKPGTNPNFREAK